MADVNSSTNNTTHDFTYEFPLHYRIIATLLHSVIFVFGCVGNVVLIWVAHKSKSLKTPTYAYLVSLAYADLFVIVTAIPEAIMFHHLGRRWVLGEACCAIFIFLNFLGINAGSLSILGFTIERFYATCRPLHAQNYCSLKKTRKIIVGLWLFAVLYCSPWFGLTEVKSDKHAPYHVQCDLRLSNEQYLFVFGLDLLLFYVIPLAVAVVAYVKIGTILYRSVRRFNPDVCQNAAACSVTYTPADHDEQAIHLPHQEDATSQLQHHCRRRRQLIFIIRSRLQVLRMLIVIVVLFAVAWLPFRGLLVYNSFGSEPWLDLWYLLFAKTIIYLNSAVNPLLYNWMSPRFRTAVHQVIRGKLPPRRNVRIVKVDRDSQRNQLTPRFPPKSFFRCHAYSH